VKWLRTVCAVSLRNYDVTRRDWLIFANSNLLCCVDVRSFVRLRDEWRSHN
jgi:hypothetical protein